MAKLPTRDNLSGPVSLRSGRAIASVDTTAIGRGINAAGDALSTMGADITQRQNTVDIARAEAYKTENLLKVQNEFDVDGDYSTFQKRAPTKTGEVVKTAANLIRDPRMRERWSLSAANDAARYNDSIFDRGVALGRQAETNALDEALETNRRLYVDPATGEDVKSKARADIEATLETAGAAGLLTPDQVAARKKLFVEDADFSRGQLAIQADPDVVVGPLPAKVADRSNAAIRYYQSRGWTREQAAGIVGNLLAESKLNTGARNPGDGRDGTDSIGIAQWNSDRARNLKKFAAANKADWQDFEVQLAFVDHELRTSEKGAGDALRKARNLDEATAAFIGYERPAGWSAANPRGGHNYSGRLKYAAQAAGEKVNPEWYDRLSPERQQTLADQADARRVEIGRDEAARQKASYTAYKDKYELSILTGGVLSEQPILSDPVLNDGDKATLLRTFRTQMGDALATAAAVQAFSGGSLRVDPYDSNGTKTVDNVYDAVSKVAPEQIQPLTEDMVRQTGVIPRQALSLIRQGMEATDMASVVAAGQAAQRIAQINPAALGRRDGGSAVQAFADDFDHYINTMNLSPEQAAQKIMDARDPKNRLQRKALEPVVKEFLKELDKVNLAAEFDDSFLGRASNPELGFDAAATFGIQAEFKAIAEDQFYKSGGDPDLAKGRALAEMKRLYGPTELTGRSVVMKHPPEKHWPAFGFRDMGGNLVPSPQKSLAYATFQLESDLREMYPDLDMSRVQLVTTPETDRMVKQGEMPGYAVMYRDGDGVMQTIPGQLWRPDTSVVSGRQEALEENRRRIAEDAARDTQGTYRMEAERARILGERDRETGNILRGGPMPQVAPRGSAPAVENPQDDSERIVDDVQIIMP
jgi:hypothetical protein